MGKTFKLDRLSINSVCASSYSLTLTDDAKRKEVWSEGFLIFFLRAFYISFDTLFLLYFFAFFLSLSLLFSVAFFLLSISMHTINIHEHCARVHDLYLEHIALVSAPHI